MLNVSVDTQGMDYIVRRLKAIPGAYRKASHLALMRALDSMRSEGIARAAEEYYAKTPELRRILTVRKGKESGYILAQGIRKSLADYYLTPKSPPKHNKGLHGAVRREGIKDLPGAFLIRLRGRYYPYIRVGRRRWDIKSLIAPAIPQLLGHENITEAMEEEAMQVFTRRFEHEALRILGALR